MLLQDAKGFNSVRGHMNAGEAEAPQNVGTRPSYGLFVIDDERAEIGEERVRSQAWAFSRLGQILTHRQHGA